MNSLPQPSPLSKHWSLREDIVYLNHGAFGACPKHVIAKQKSYIDQLEFEPTQFSTRNLFDIYPESKKSLAEFIGTSEHNIYFVPNTTIGINQVLHNQRESHSDWLITNHAYGAISRAYNHFGQLKKCHVINIEIPYPIESENDILNRIESSITEHTSLALVDYISSASALVFPIKKVIDFLHSKNIQVIIDGAHAPGMIDLNIDNLDADYFIANCHKWICSPKGSAFVYVNPRHQDKFKPIYTSFYNDWDLETEKHWSNQFIWEGTKDHSAYLCVKDAIEYLPTLIENGWNGIREHNMKLAYRGAIVIANKLGVELPAPKEMLGSIINIPLWDGQIPKKKFHHFTETKKTLYHQYRIEAPCMLFPEAPKQYIRISAQLYNSIEQYEYLADCLLKIRDSKSS